MIEIIAAVVAIGVLFWVAAALTLLKRKRAVLGKGMAERL
jgi:hypothetical protein